MAGQGQRRRPKKSARSRRSNLRITRVEHGPEVGPGVVTATLEELEAALEGHPDDLAWDWASAHVIPVMRRIRPYPSGFPEPMYTVVDPGVAVGFAIDIGPAFMSIGADLLRSWGIPLSDVHTRSLGNVIERAQAIDGTEIHEGAIDTTPTRWLQTGQSIGSVLVLTPDELRRIFGPGPAFFITPMRDLIIGLPPNVDRELAAWLWLEVASLDPNCLGPIGYRFDGQSVRPDSLDLPIHELGLDAPPSSTHVA
jgi:hypothetical protein